jgi:regulation of enolase protein 1 (concanavalin A-like superfamily)
MTPFKFQMAEQAKELNICIERMTKAYRVKSRKSDTLLWSLFRQSNIKIQKAVVKGIYNAHMRLPASDLERSIDQ